MEVKGSAVISTPKYMKEKYPSQYEKWLDALSQESRHIMQSVLASNWYPLDAGFIQPTKAACDILQNGSKKVAWDMGRYSAEYSLNGVYRVFFRIGSPAYLISRGAKVFSSYYKPCELNVTSNDSKNTSIQITEFPESSEYIENRIAGWMEKALELCGVQGIQVAISQSMAKGDALTEIQLKWD